MLNYHIKQNLFLYLTPRQKSQLLSFLKSFVKKHSNLSVDDIFDKFTEEENYYSNIENPHFEFIIGYLENEDFYKDFKLFVKSVFDELKYKEAQKPIIEAQKAKAKEFRKKAQDFKMSKLKPTKKQLYYYEKVARAHNVKMNEVKNASRLDLRNWIMEIIDPVVENTEGEE